MNLFTENHLVQTTTAEYMEQQLGRENIFAYNNKKDFGEDSLLGRSNNLEIILTRFNTERKLVAKTRRFSCSY